jgi:PAS domain S-box-containing protein
MTKNGTSGTGIRRMSKAELTEKMRALQASFEQQSELQEVLHELEVYQIELEMQTRELTESRLALEESLERYVSLYDFAPTGYVTLDSNGMMKDINLTLTTILGVDRMSVLGRSMSPWILPSDIGAFRLHLKKCRTEQGPVTTEIRLIRRDKTVVYVELVTSPCIDPAVLDHQFRTSVMDISARKKAEEERDKFFDLSNDLLSLTGTDGFFKRVNPAWEDATGFTSAELLAHPYINFIHPDDRALILERLPTGADSAMTRSNEVRFIKKDRSIIWLTWKAVLANGLYYSVARDTSSEHQEKKEIENDQKWLREMIEAIPTAMILVEGGTGKIISMSSGVHDMSGAGASDIPYFAQPDFVSEDSQGNVLAGESLPRNRAARGEKFNGELVVWRTPVGVYHLRVFSRNIPAKYGRPAMALVVFQDVSDLKKSEKSLTEAVTNLEQERDVRERFVSTLTHDLRTPLSAVKMGSQLMLKHKNNADIVEVSAAQVLESVERLDVMIGDLLDANRISAGEKLPLKIRDSDLVALVKKTLPVLAAIHGDRFVLEGLIECSVRLDQRAMRRVIENLCNNAIKYGDPLRPVAIKIEKNDQHILISVHNDGAAIPEADQPNLFNPFQRTLAAQVSGKRGWGIGLTLIRGITEAHGGRVYLNSSAAKGTTFYVELPLLDQLV